MLHRGAQRLDGEGRQLDGGIRHMDPLGLAQGEADHLVAHRGGHEALQRFIHEQARLAHAVRGLLVLAARVFPSGWLHRSTIGQRGAGPGSVRDARGRAVYAGTSRNTGQ
ncbi:MAG: hypothetical protein HY744_25225 [Deltaproteobacteria bacterium]|nr:hypothetical protein [Deltaproteobacteria bacterium]